MIKFLKCTVITALVLIANSSNGQDIHFSQFGMSNLTLNPATTGVMTCNARFSLVYRNQWASVAGRYAFNTFGFGGEAKFNAGKNDFYGVGLSVWGDVAGASQYRTIATSISGSYMKKIGGRREKRDDLLRRFHGWVEIHLRNQHRVRAHHPTKF